MYTGVESSQGHFNYLLILFVNYTSINLGKRSHETLVKSQWLGPSPRVSESIDFGRDWRICISVWFRNHTWKTAGLEKLKETNVANIWRKTVSWKGWELFYKRKVCTEVRSHRLALTIIRNLNLFQMLWEDI